MLGDFRPHNTVEKSAPMTGVHWYINRSGLASVHFLPIYIKKAMMGQVSPYEVFQPWALQGPPPA